MGLEINTRFKKELKRKVTKDVKGLNFNDTIKEYAAAKVLEEIELEARKFIESVCAEGYHSRIDLLENSVSVITHIKGKVLDSEEKPCTELLFEMARLGLISEEGIHHSLNIKVEDIKNSLIESVL